MKERLPTLATYLERHGGRLDRYPQCGIKAGLMRMALQRMTLPPLDGLPEDFVRTLRNPPPVNVWIPEMHIIALQCIHADVTPQDAVESWLLEMNRQLLSSPAYSVLFALASPQSVLKGAARLWGVFRRGSKLDVVIDGPGSARATVTFPEYLYIPEAPFHHGTAFTAALLRAGAAKVSVAVEEHTPTSARYHATWG